MYRLFVEQNLSEVKLAALLNERGVTSDLGRPWTRGTIHQVLTNEKYIGNNVYNRVSFELKKKRVVNPPNMWIRANTAFEPIVPAELYVRAQDIIRARTRRYSNDELLAQLRELLTFKGCLSGLLIHEQENMASSSVYRSRFTSLLRAYSLIGYTPERDYQFIETNRHLRRIHANVVKDVLAKIRELGGTIQADPATDLLTVNAEFTASVVLARCRQITSGAYRWFIRLDAGLKPDITVAVRMDGANQDPLDYYLLPGIDLTFEKLLLAEDNALSLDTFRFSSLDFFFGMAQRARITEAA